jgi:hypothetical protein
MMRVASCCGNFPETETDVVYYRSSIGNLVRWDLPRNTRREMENDLRALEPLIKRTCFSFGRTIRGANKVPATHASLAIEETQALTQMRSSTNPAASKGCTLAAAQGIHSAGVNQPLDSSACKHIDGPSDSPTRRCF